MRLLEPVLAILAATLAAAPARAAFEDERIISAGDLDSLEGVRRTSRPAKVGSLTVTSVEPDRFHEGARRVKATRADGLRVHLVVEPGVHGRGERWTHLYLHDAKGGYLHVYPGPHEGSPGQLMGVRATRSAGGPVKARMLSVPASRLR